MLQSGLTKQLVEADILLLIEAERILVTRCFAMLSSFLVGIHSFRLERRSTRENATASQSEDLCRTNANLSDKGTPRYPLARVKTRRRKPRPKISTNAWRGSRSRGVSRCNITTVSEREKTAGADWSGRERTSESRYFRRLYLAEPIVILLFGPWDQYQLNNTKKGVLIKSTHGAKDKVNKVIYRPFHI